MFSKKKKKPQISCPTNFEHRVHTGFDKREGRYIGLPLQWASIVGNNQILKSTNRPLPLVDPSEITPTEILDLKTIVRGDNKSENRLSMQQVKPNTTNGIVLPKTSNVARSNSLRSSSPPRLRKDTRHNTNVPPAVPEEQILQYPSMRRDPSISKPQVRESSPAERSVSNHEVQNAQINGNVQEVFPTFQQSARDVNQISPAGSITSVPAVIPQLQSNHLPVGPHQNVTHAGYPSRPDQNQNIKNGPTSNPSTTSATSSSGKHHEQRLTHEQVVFPLQFHCNLKLICLLIIV